jgi:GNAT superfamily N-acetyltransferase
MQELHGASDVREMAPSDLAFVREAYRDSLDGGFFGELGDGFLEAYLKTYVGSPAGLAFIAESQGLPVGFLVGAVDARSHRAHVLASERQRLLVKGGTALLVRPHMAWKFARTRMVKYGRAIARQRRREPAPGGRREAVGIVAHMAVVDAARGTGLGTALESRFVSSCAAAGVSSLELVTASHNKRARAFYRRNGWSEDGTRTDTDGRTWIVMGKRT